jgi:WD repeat and SOF domain-containing protein 1
MDRLFAKPFIASLEGHVDAVEVMAKQPGSLTTVASGSWDGGVYLKKILTVILLNPSLGVIVHHLARRSQLLHAPQAHKGKVSGVCFSRDGRLFSCGVDRSIKLWSLESSHTENPQPVTVFTGKSAFKWVFIRSIETGIDYLLSSIDHHNSDPLFASASNLVQIWDETKYVPAKWPFLSSSPFRSLPVSHLTFPTSTETINSVRFNLSETSVLASIGSDRTFTLYDIRTGKAERRVVMQVLPLIVCTSSSR